LEKKDLEKFSRKISQKVPEENILEKISKNNT
jgi:hypothetical protein